MTGSIVHGENILEQIHLLLRRYGFYADEGLAIHGSGISKNIVDAYFKEWDSSGIDDSTFDTVKELEGIVKYKRFLVAIGGGKVIDTGKVTAGNLGLPFVSIPTTLSNDGIFSPIGVIKKNHTPESILTKPPELLILDYSIIRSSPKELLLAGIGDLVSNLSAILDWKLAVKLKKDTDDIPSMELSYEGAETFLETEEEPFSIPFIKTLAHGLIKSGLAMQRHGSSRPASGAEHLISHALDKILEKPLIHGIQCGFATLFTVLLHGEMGLFLRIKEFYERVGFPTTLEQVGIPEERFREAVKLAPFLRPNRFTILHKNPEIEDALRYIT